MGFQSDIRAASVSLLTDYAASTTPALKLQVYPARPRSIAPPTAFVDSIREHIDFNGPTLLARSPVVEMLVIHGIFDSAEAADQKDAFVDGFIEWCRTRYHQASANTLVGLSDTEDLPNYVPEWMPPERQLVYYATRLTLEGYG
jgi:hypothetical protein